MFSHKLYLTVAILAMRGEADVVNPFFPAVRASIRHASAFSAAIAARTHEEDTLYSTDISDTMRIGRNLLSIDEATNTEAEEANPSPSASADA